MLLSHHVHSLQHLLPSGILHLGHRIANPVLSRSSAVKKFGTSDPEYDLYRPTHFTYDDASHRRTIIA
jgi:hypothetical protein